MADAQRMLKGCGAVTTMEQELVVVSLAVLEASFTWAVKLKVPAEVGVPVMAPVAGLRFKPVGSDPEIMEYVYGVMPPEATSDEL